MADVNLADLGLAVRCLFAALLQSTEAFGDPSWTKHQRPNTAKYVRTQVVSALLTMEKSKAPWYDGKAPAHEGWASCQEYCEDMKKVGSWGCIFVHIAACKVWHLQAVVIIPVSKSLRGGSGRRTVWLRLHNGHYESLQPNLVEDCKARRKEYTRGITEI